MKTYTVTLTVNMHVQSKSEEDALQYVVNKLPFGFDIIDEETKESAEQDEQEG